MAIYSRQAPEMRQVSLKGGHKVLLLMSLQGTWSVLPNQRSSRLGVVLSNKHQAASNGKPAKQTLHSHRTQLAGTTTYALVLLQSACL